MGRVLPFAALQWLTLDHTRRDAVDRFHGLVATDPRPVERFHSLVVADPRPHKTWRSRPVPRPCSDRSPSRIAVPQPCNGWHATTHDDTSCSERWQICDHTRQAEV